MVRLESQPRSERPHECGDDLLNNASELLQRWNKKLTFPLSNLRERYLGQDYDLVIQCFYHGPALVNGYRFSLSMRACRCNNLGRGIRREDEVSSTLHNDQFPMLIESVHVVDDAEGMVNRVCSQLVGLKIGDELANYAGVGDSAYLSLKSFQVVRVGRFNEDRELNRVLIPRGLPIGGIGKNPNDVVETRTEMMNDLASQNPEPLRNCKRLMVLNRILPALVLWLGDNRVFAFLKEPENLIAEISDVLIGPL